MEILSVIGLGKLGTPMLAVFAGAGYDVIGYDLDTAKRDAIANGRVPTGIHEPNTQALLDDHHDHISTVDSIRAAVLMSDVTFVIVPTPSGDDGGFTLEYLHPVCEYIGAALIEKKQGHTVAIVSTVMPGQMSELCRVIEHASGKRHGAGFGLVYSPEFIALGSVVHDLQHPDYVLIGHEHEHGLAQVMDVYRQVTNGADVVATAWANAEIAKIAQNAFITMKITFANQLGNLCQRIPGANVDDVMEALGHDARIGPKFLTAGTAYGGPCFPRDNRALMCAGENAHADFGELVETVDRLNKYAQDNIADLVYAFAPDAKTVGFIGLAYKPGTNVTEESATMIAAKQLALDYAVVIYDPLAMSSDPVNVPSAQGVIDAADVVVVMHRDQTLIGVNATAFTDKIVIDPWRIMPRDIAAYCKQYIPLGIGPETQEVTA